MKSEQSTILRSLFPACRSGRDYSIIQFVFAFFCSLLFYLNASAQEQQHYTCYRTDGIIVPDGCLTEPDWEQAEWSDDFVDITGDPKHNPGFRTRVKMLWNEECIYIAAEMQEPEIWATIRQKDAVIFHDNDFEIFLDPDGDGMNYYEIEVNALGTVWDLLLTKPYRDHGKPVSSWDLNGLKTGIHINGTLNDPSGPDTSWTVEMALPVSELVAGKKPGSRPADGIQWRMNFSRVEWETEIHGSSYRKKIDPATGKLFPESNWVWSPMGEVSMHIPERWGWLEFSSSDIKWEPVKFNSEQQKKEFQVMVWMGGHDSWTNEKWDSVFSGLKTHGISGILTQAQPATLARIIPIAGQYGIFVEKWFITMMNNDPGLLKDHPEWFVVSREGKSCISDPAYVGYYRFLCPSNPEVRDYLRNRIGEYLDIPGLKGIHLDYIRYPDVILPQALWTKYGIVQDKEYAPYDYCYCNICLEKFRSTNGADPFFRDHPDSNDAWRQFRYDEVTSVVSELSEFCHGKDKSISAAVFPGPSLAKQLVRQEWNKWPLDGVMPMLYQNFYYGSLDWIRHQTSEGVESIEKPIPYFSGLYIPSLNPRDLQTAFLKSIQGGAHGVCIFNYESMTPRHWKALKEVLPDGDK